MCQFLSHIYCDRKFVCTCLRSSFLFCIYISIDQQKKIIYQTIEFSKKNAGELLNIDEFIPTYATVTDQQISKGVNYASGGAGILPETGNHLVKRPILASYP